MKTEFSLAQLADPKLAKADEILRKCVHCGFCTAHCPTYQVLGNELDSPRGRIQLYKDVLETGRAMSPAERTHADRCLTCGACNSVCPSGVDYLGLVDIAREHIEETGGRPVLQKLWRRSVAFIMGHGDLFRLGQVLGRLAKPFRVLVPGGAGRMLDVLPERAATGTQPAAGWHQAEAEQTRIGFFQNCVQPSLRPDIDEAAMRVLTRGGASVLMGQSGVCCGALDKHLGHAHAAAKKKAAAAPVFDGHALDAITYSVSGCGPTLREEGYFQAPVKDLAVLMSGLELCATRPISGLKVAVQAPCTQQHGAGLPSAMQDLLSGLGFTTVPVADAHLCCGAAGTYTIFQPDLSDQLGERKAQALANTGADIVVSANIGCLTHLNRFEDTPPILHFAELVDWATGGPVPQAAAHILG